MVIRHWKIFLIGGLILAIGGIHFSCRLYSVSQIHNVVLKFFYIPIVMAAFWWGIRGGVAVGILCAVVYSVDLFCWPASPGLRLLNPLSEILLFTGVGTLLGWMVDHDRACRIKRYEAEERAEREFRRSITDPLTQAFNRRYMDKILGDFFTQTRRGGKSFSLLMIDLNGFKSINDHHGHLAGDQVLRSAVQTLFQHTRQTDFVFRYGGDEFVILLPETKQDFAFSLARRLKQEFGKLSFRNQENTPFRADFSIGIIEYQSDFTSVEEMLTKLDEALYQAKKETAAPLSQGFGGQTGGEGKSETVAREIILDAIRTRGKAQRRDLLPLVTVSKSTLVRLLDKMEAEGLVVQIGEKKAAFYALPEPKQGAKRP